VLPLYLKKAYKDDPIFSNAKVVLSLFDDTPAETFSPGFAGTLAFGAVKSADIPLGEQPDGIELAKLAVQYSDGIILGSPDVDKSLVEYSKQSGLPLLDYNQDSFADGSYMDAYNAFYDNLLK
jgi:starch synthase